MGIRDRINHQPILACQTSDTMKMSFGRVRNTVYMLYQQMCHNEYPYLLKDQRLKFFSPLPFPLHWKIPFPMHRYMYPPPPPFLRVHAVGYFPLWRLTVLSINRYLGVSDFLTVPHLYPNSYLKSWLVVERLKYRWYGVNHYSLNLSNLVNLQVILKKYYQDF